MPMLSGDHSDAMLGSNNPVRPVQRVLKHGTGSDESAILLGFVSPEPSLNERVEPFSVASSQNDRP